MTNFNTTYNVLLEIHCWKGYRKVGTKIKNGKRVNDCRPVKEDDSHPSPRSQFRVTGQFVFVNPHDTGKKHYPVNTVVSAVSARQAAFLAAKRVATEKKIKYSQFYPDMGYKVEQLPYTPPPPPRMPYID